MSRRISTSAEGFEQYVNSLARTNFNICCRQLASTRKAKTRRYNKSYPCEMIHFNTNRLPFLKSEDKTIPLEHQFVAIDDFSRILYTAILPYKSQHSDTTFLQQVLDELTQNGVQAQSYTVLL